jgi:4-hydroxy-3-polyprenylbenzoate decarboxylase
MSLPSEIRNPKSEIVLGMTGASGGPYAVRLLDCLEAAGRAVHLIVSPLGRQLLADECGVKQLEPQALIGRPSDRIRIHNHRDVGCELASGSYLTGGMVICPCTSNTLGAIASGLGDNLIARAAQVTLKEGRRLVIVHREMPLGAIDLENMLRIQRAGGIICPAVPGFYMQPQTVGDLVDFVVGKVLDLLGVEHTLNTRWAKRQAQCGGSPESPGHPSVDRDD